MSHLTAANRRRVIDHNDECVGCGEHWAVVHGHGPKCTVDPDQHDTHVDTPTVLRAAAAWLADNRAGRGVDLPAAIRAAAVDLLGDQFADQQTAVAIQVFGEYVETVIGAASHHTREQAVVAFGVAAGLTEAGMALYAAAARHGDYPFEPTTFGQIRT